MFDHAVLKNGQEVPFNASIQALASAQSATAASTGADDMMASGGGMGAVARNGAERRRPCRRRSLDGGRHGWCHDGHHHEYS